MKTLVQNLGRIAGGAALMGFFLVASGCVIAPDRYHDGDRERDHQRDRGEYHCDREHDEHCRDRDRDR